jgi:hydrogenase-4 component B
MGYTATAFSAPVRVLFESLLRPVVRERQHSQGSFLISLERKTHVVHLVDRLFLNPVSYAVKAIGRSLAWLHQGPVTLYATWVLATLFAALMAMKFSL